MAFFNEQEWVDTYFTAIVNIYNPRDVQKMKVGIDKLFTAGDVYWESLMQKVYRIAQQDYLPYSKIFETQELSKSRHYHLMNPELVHRLTSEEVYDMLKYAVGLVTLTRMSLGSGPTGGNAGGMATGGGHGVGMKYIEFGQEQSLGAFGGGYNPASNMGHSMGGDQSGGYYPGAYIGHSVGGQQFPQGLNGTLPPGLGASGPKSPGGKLGKLGKPDKGDKGGKPDKGGKTDKYEKPENEIGGLPWMPEHKSPFGGYKTQEPLKATGEGGWLSEIPMPPWYKKP